MVGGNGGNQFRQYARQNVGNLNGFNDVQNVRNQAIQNAVQNPRIQNVGNQNRLIVVPGNANQNPNGNSNLVAARAEDNATGHNGNQIRCYNCRGLGHFSRNFTVKLLILKEEARIQLQAEEFDLMAAAADLNEIEEVNANYILMANLQQASTSSTQTDKAPVYDSNGSAEVHNYKDCYDNEIFNMLTQEEQYTELLEPIPEPHQVPHNDNNVIFEVFSVEQSGKTVEKHPVNVEETRVLYDSLYNNLAIEVEKVNTVNRKFSETKVELTTELARYKNQEKCFEISQEKYYKLERCYQKSVFQEQRLSKKINALHLSSDEIFPIVNQVDARVQNFEIQFMKEAAKFVRDFKSLAKEADESLAKHKALELEIKRLLRAVVRKPPKVGETHALSKPVTLNLIPTPQRSKVVKNVKVITPGMFRINPFKPSSEEKHVPNKVRASKVVNSDANGLSSTKVDNTAKTRRLQPRRNTKNNRVPSASKSSCSKNKGVDVEEHLRNFLLSNNKKHTSSECNKFKLATQNVNSKVVCAMCKKKQKPKVKKTKKVGSIERHASPKPSKPRPFLRKPDISFLHVFDALCYPENDREDIGKLGPRGKLDLLFEAMYDDYIGGQPSTAPRTVSAVQAHQVHQTSTTSTSIENTAPTPTDSSSQATNFLNTSQDVDALNSQQQHAQQQGNQAPIQPKIVAGTVPNAMLDANSFANPFANPSTSAAESSSSQYVDP
nr:hypothetical protein [Tanacetum cinerariifolium]